MNGESDTSQAMKGRISVSQNRIKTLPARNQKPMNGRWLGSANAHDKNKSVARR
jgi:hypothetical protein